MSKVAKKEKAIVKTENIQLPNVLKLSFKSIDVIIKNWKLFSVVLAIYFLLTMLFVRGFKSTINVVNFKNNYVGNNIKPSALGADLSAFGNVVGSSFSNNAATGGLFQTLFFVIFSLIFIWMIREIIKKNKITIRDSFYKSQYPFIQFFIILFFLAAELVPALFGAILYATIFNNGIAGSTVEKVLWILVVLLFVIVSIYLVVSSIFALYIVTVPDVKPFEAIRSSWKMVKGRRMVVLRKVLFMPIALLLLISILSILFVAVIPRVSDFIFFALSIIGLLIGQSYMYNLYRELL